MIAWLIGGGTALFGQTVGSASAFSPSFWQPAQELVFTC